MHIDCVFWKAVLKHGMVMLLVVEGAVWCDWVLADGGAVSVLMEAMFSGLHLGL